MRKKRSAGAIAAATLVVIVIMGALSFASKHDEEDAQAMAADYAEANRKSIVARWYIPQGE